MLSWVFVILISLGAGQLIWWRWRSMTVSNLAIFTVLSFKSLWFVIVAIPFGLLAMCQWVTRRSRPWRKIHFPMMQVHASAAAFEVIDSEREEREWDIRNVLIRMVVNAHPDWDMARVIWFISKEIAKIQSFQDWPLMRNHILSKEPQMDEVEVDKFLEEAKSGIDIADNGLLTRAVIAGLVEEKCGVAQKGEYLFAMITGKAL